MRERFAAYFVSQGVEEAVFPYHYLFIMYGKPGESVFVLYII